MANMGWLISMVNISINTSNQPKTIQSTLCWDSMTFGKTFTCHHSYWTKGNRLCDWLTSWKWVTPTAHFSFISLWCLFCTRHSRRFPVSTWLSATSWEKIDRHEEFRVTKIKGIIRGVLSVLTRQWLWMTGSQARISRASIWMSCKHNSTTINQDHLSQKYLHSEIRYILIF